MNDNRLRWVKSFWKVVLKIGNICFVAQSFLELRLCRRYTCNILRSCAICLANSGTNTVHIISHYLSFIGNSYGSFFQAPKQKAVFQYFVFYLHLYAAIWRYENKRLNLSFIMLYSLNLSKFLIFFVLGEVWQDKVRTTQMVKTYDGGTGVLDELVIIEDCNDPYCLKYQPQRYDWSGANKKLL